MTRCASRRRVKRLFVVISIRIYDSISNIANIVHTCVRTFTYFTYIGLCRMSLAHLALFIRPACTISVLSYSESSIAIGITESK